MRDRNHPSIILWSLCNEQWIQGSPEAAAMAKAMKQRSQRTRPYTARDRGNEWFRIPGRDFSACWTWSASITIQEYTQEFHTEFPAKPMVATEIASEFGTRGFYEMNHWENYWGDKDRGYFAAYSINTGGKTVENAWRPSLKTNTWREDSYGADSITKANPGRSAGRASTLTTASWTSADFPRTATITTKPGGRTNQCCISSRTGTGGARKARKFRCGFTATARKWNFFSTAFRWANRL